MSIIVFDIETGPVPQAELKRLYKEPTFEEFCSSCDPRWKDDTKKAKFAEKQSGAWGQFVDRAALSPITGQVLAVGLRSEKGVVVIGDEGESEPDILDAWWCVYANNTKQNRRFVGFNCSGFDIPFLIRRSWFHGISVPQSVFETNGRYLSKNFLDLMVLWACMSREFVPLDTVSRFFGIGGKPDGVDGSHFAKLWLSGKPEDRKAATEYLANDLDMTWKLAERLQVLA